MDFGGDWFAPRWESHTESATEALSSFVSSNGTLTDLAVETASLAVSAINGTGGSLATAAMDGVRRRIGGGNVAAGTTSSGFEALKSLRRYGINIPCVDVIIRL